MARKLKHVEDLCQHKRAVKSSPAGSHRHRRPSTDCVDNDGVLHLNGATWEKDNCTECHCQVTSVHPEICFILMALFEKNLQINDGHVLLLLTTEWVHSVYDAAVPHVRQSAGSGRWVLPSLRRRVKLGPPHFFIREKRSNKQKFVHSNRKIF